MCIRDRVCADHPYIGIGGFAIKHIQPSEYGYIRRLVQYANSCGVRVHGLGYTKKDAVSFGFYSVDLSLIHILAKACYPEYEKFDVAKMEVISDE